MRHLNRQKKPSKPTLSATPVELSISHLSIEGRGISHLDGKTVFVRGALPNEQIVARITAQHKRFDEAETLEVLSASPDRQTPPCDHYQLCGGCDLQHLNPQKALSLKYALVLDQLQRFAQCQPIHMDNAIPSPSFNYRRSARIGVNRLQRDQSLVVGFRRRQSSKLVNIETCPVLDTRLERVFELTRHYFSEQPDNKSLTHIDALLGDDSGALTFRVTRKPTNSFMSAMINLCNDLNLQGWVEDNDGNLSPVQSNYPALTYRPSPEVELSFKPGNFLQVNSQINQALIQLALEWLQPSAEDYVLDLFCGLGNFTLPLAKKAHKAIGVEGMMSMVKQAQDNADKNQIHNTVFYCADLSSDVSHAFWFKEPITMILLDPPRSGAHALVSQIASKKAKKILYIACNPAALTRDTQVLCAAGYQLSRFTVLDMFPNTAHIESVALFERSK
ncbi:23S rRNA (uracil(1939)-C(5))-methyltransferase RlmD [Nitrincola alkalisediminis]|uniref:23S rRNA (uracil(1939)-C(5))-methyltransferase RlmD n=1 Tax=Nitrincola alkalisediminis TaxID=1366656 RepID=UPI001874994D|nr:23S rRNA (uracil(1939)-C(5))-methyltransferase RlmD [Nitrincola alkalisediminis]